MALIRSTLTSPPMASSSDADPSPYKLRRPSSSSSLVFPPSPSTEIIEGQEEEEEITFHEQRDAEDTTEDDNVWDLTSLPLETYSTDDLLQLCQSIGAATTTHLECLEIHAVDGLNWNMILNGHDANDACCCSCLQELVVTIRSQRALVELASALCYKNSLVRLELDYQIDGAREVSTSSNNDDLATTNNALIDMTDVYASINHNILLEAIKPIEHVVVRGIALQRLPESSSCYTKPCSWRHLTLENCGHSLEYAAQSWVAPAIGSLESLVLTDCQLSNETIPSLAEAYLEYCTRRTVRNGATKQKQRKARKAPLRTLDLSSNSWDGQIESNGDSDKANKHQDNLPSPSYMSSLASWMDSLSNLVELNLSNNPWMFSPRNGMSELCGTFHHSLLRLSLRHCNLCPSDLDMLTATFCWLEALDLSENAGLMEDMSPLLSLEHLSELVLENMSGSGLSAEETSLGPFATFDGLDIYLQALALEEQASLEVADQQCRCPLQRLNLSGNILKNESMQAIHALTSLKVLILINCRMESTGLIRLLRGENRRSSPPLPWKEIYLSSNNIGDEGALELACSLKDQRLATLRVLQLESNTISANALKTLVHDGVASSLRLESLSLWDIGAYTSNQQASLQEVEELMRHYLLLNRARREVLFWDKDPCGNEKKIPAHLWPNILEEAFQMYGANVIFYFLRHRPDLIFPQQAVADSVDATAAKEDHPATLSPRGVADFDFKY